MALQWALGLAGLTCGAPLFLACSACSSKESQDQPDPERGLDRDEAEKDNAESENDADKENDTESGSGGAPATEPRAGVSLHFAPSEDCDFEGWVDFPSGFTRAVTAKEHPRLIAHQHEVTFVSCEYKDGSPQKFFLSLNAPEDGVSRSVSLAPHLSTAEPLEHAIRITDGHGLGRTPEEPLCNFQAIEIASDLSSVWGKVSCAKLVRDDNSGDCHLDEGYFYFEGCKPRP